MNDNNNDNHRNGGEMRVIVSWVCLQVPEGGTGARRLLHCRYRSMRSREDQYQTHDKPEDASGFLYLL